MELHAHSQSIDGRSSSFVIMMSRDDDEGDFFVVIDDDAKVDLKIDRHSEMEKRDSTPAAVVTDS